MSGSECARVLDITGLWIYLWFWICQDSEYTRVLNMPGLGRLQNMPGYAWLCLDMTEYWRIWYAWLCLNLPERFLFYIFPVVTLRYTWLPIWRATEIKAYRGKSWFKFNNLGFPLRMNMRLFSWRDNIWFFIIAAGSISFVYCFLLPLGDEGRRCLGLWILI